jgi:hypothetical protein
MKVILPITGRNSSSNLTFSFRSSSKREPKDVEEADGAAAAVSGRDVFNEKPSLEDMMTAEGERGLSNSLLFI